MTELLTRPIPQRSEWLLTQAGVHPLLARLLAARGVTQPEDVQPKLAQLLPPEGMLGLATAARLLADAIVAGKRLLIVADYDCDGATACALGVRALRAFGAIVDYLVPDRFKLGYGLSPAVVELARQRRPDLLVTVDNGIASVEGVALAARYGLPVIVTDHHLPGDVLPPAAAIVDPNQKGCPFASKALSGVGVMFYVMLALRAELRRRGVFTDRPEPNLASLLDLVALGTVADVVPLDRNNRILVAEGLVRMRAGRLQPGVAALFAVAGRNVERASTFDLGFALGPRLNAAGRLADMGLGIECLITDDAARAMNLAQQLDAINRERRQIEASMQEEAEAYLEGLDVGDACSLTLFDPGWHQGIVGILAGRLKERHHRPTFAFAPDEDGTVLKGSGRSIPGLHLRDALDLIVKRHPGLLLRFGGHAAAAGASVPAARFDEFAAAFERVCRDLLDAESLEHRLLTDGALESAYYSLEVARLLESVVWGQGFPPPLFADRFEVLEQKLLKDKHLKLTLGRGGVRYEAMRFGCRDPLPARITAAFRLEVNEYQGLSSLRLGLEHLAPA